MTCGSFTTPKPPLIWKKSCNAISQRTILIPLLSGQTACITYARVFASVAIDRFEATSFQSHFQKLRSGAQPYHMYKRQWADEVERCQYRHKKLVLNATQRIKDFEKKAAEARRLEQTQFPMSKEQFYVRPKEMQTLVADFLSRNAPTQERWMSKYSWPSRQVQPLKELYAKDVSHHFAVFPGTLTNS